MVSESMFTNVWMSFSLVANVEFKMGESSLYLAYVV